MAGLLDPYVWDRIIFYIQEGRWEDAKRLLIERDGRVDSIFDSFSYTPTLTQTGGQSASPPSGEQAKVIRIDRLIVFHYAPAFDFTDVTGSATDPQMFISLPPQIADSEVFFVGMSRFETSVLEYKSGGVTMDSANNRLITFPNEAFQSPPITALSDLLGLGVTASWWLPESLR